MGDRGRTGPADVILGGGEGGGGDRDRVASLAESRRIVTWPSGTGARDGEGGTLDALNLSEGTDLSECGDGVDKVGERYRFGSSMGLSSIASSSVDIGRDAGRDGGREGREGGRSNGLSLNELSLVRGDLDG